MLIPDVSFPPMPASLPPSLQALQSIRRDRRERILQGLYLLAITGLSVGQELRAVMEIILGVSPGSLSIQQVFHTDLPVLGLVVKETPYFIRSSRLALFRLSDLGRQACLELGWPVVESEWDRLIHSHEGLLYPRHTLGLLAFCWQARLRDWRTELLPQVNASLEPDMLVSKGNVKIYAEFEIRAHEKRSKWKKISRFQDFVALASFTPKARYGLVQECRGSHIAGYATDLQNLMQNTSYPGALALWVESWIHG
ncbi:MAG: hypothetical protein AB1894_15350 [Chloroflexota bacterium]